MSRRILITGAGIAGNTVAWWLGRAGFEVTVVERAPAFRDGGQNVDVRGSSREVLRRMRLEQAALDQGTSQEGTAWIDEKGGVAARFLTADQGADRPAAEMEILRGDLVRLRYARAAEHASYRFGDGVAAIVGIGTTLAITGAYVLAAGLARSGDIVAAFAAYEQAMRPMVKVAQGVPKIAPRVMNPPSRLGIRLLHSVPGVASRPAFCGVAWRAKCSAVARRRLTCRAMAGQRTRPERACPRFPKIHPPLQRRLAGHEVHA